MSKMKEKQQFLDYDGLSELIGYIKQFISNDNSIKLYASYSVFPKPGESNIIYIDTTTNLTYYWNNASKEYKPLDVQTWNTLNGKPDVFPPATHDHDDKYYTESEIDSKLNNYLPLHGGTINGNVTFNSTISSPAPEGSNASQIVILPRVSYEAIDSTHTDPIYFKELAKWICKNYPDHTHTIFIGSCNPNFAGTVILEIYNTSNLKDGYPEYASGQYTGPTITSTFTFYDYNYSFNVLSKEGHTHSIIKDSGNANDITFSYSKTGLSYDEYTWLAGWNGYELRAIDKNQFATSQHSHPYLPLSGGDLSGALTIHNGNADKVSPISQDIVINAPNTDDIKREPGIGFHIADMNYATLKYVHDNSFRFYNYNLSEYVSVYASVFHGLLDGNASTASSLSSVTPTLSVGIENSAITIKSNENGSLSTSSYAALRNAIDFQWYDTNWQIGNIRSGNTASQGFGFAFKNSDESSFSLKSYIDLDGYYNGPVRGNIAGDLYGNVINGNVKLSQHNCISQTQIDTSNYTWAIDWKTNHGNGWYYNDSDGSSKKYIYDPQIGQHNSGGDGTGSITILPYATNEEPWSGKVGLFISKTSLKINNNVVLHSGNYTEYAASSSHDHNYITVQGYNTISSISDDTTANWGNKQTSLHFYSQTGMIKDQPSQWGYLLNLGAGSEVHQLWMSQASGSISHRGGNSAGWEGSWRRILDSVNYNDFTVTKDGSGATGTWGINVTGSAGSVAWGNVTGKPGSFPPASHNHDYLPLSGGTMTGPISYRGSKNTYQMITFYDASDEYGNGIGIGGGGLTIIGGGEATSTVKASIPNGGSERMIIANDDIIEFYTHCQDGLSTATRTLIDNSGVFSGTASMAITVKDYNNGGKINIGYSGAGISGDQIKHICGFTTGTNGALANIKDISKDNLKAWLGSMPPNFHTHDYVVGSYTSNGGQQNPNYFGTNKVGFLMMNTTVNGDSYYKDWIIMDCYSGGDVGGGVAFGVNRQKLGAYIMRSDASRTAWAQSAELLHTANYTDYTVTKTGGGASGTWGINITGNSNYANSAGSASSASSANSANYLNIVAGNEIRFNKPSWSSKTPLWFGWAWSDNSKSEIISQYNMGNGNGGLAPIAASRFIGNADSATNADRAYYLSGHGVRPSDSHPGHGARIFYSWNTGAVGNESSGYSNGITIGSHPSDTAYGFQIVQNMWDDRTYTRRYNAGWQEWKTLAWTSDNTWRPCVDNLSSYATDQSLSANQGRALNEKLEKMFPIGYIFIWNNRKLTNFDETLSGAPALTSAQAVHDYFGFGTWQYVGDTFLYGNPNSQGGASTVSLGVGNMPSHTHSIPALSGWAASNGAHTHNVRAKYTNNCATKSGGSARANGGGNNTSDWRFGDTDSQGAHGHNVSTNASTTGSNGSGSAFSIMPPYKGVYIWQRIA